MNEAKLFKIVTSQVYDSPIYAPFFVDNAQRLFQDNIRVSLPSNTVDGSAHVTISAIGEYEI